MLSRLIGALVLAVSFSPIARAQWPESMMPETAGSSASQGVYAEDPMFSDALPRDLSGLFGGPSRFWLTGEYLLGFTPSDSLPVLATSAPVGSFGTLGAADTTVLIGGEQKFDSNSGFRFGGGLWLDSCRAYGVEWSFSLLPRQSKSYDFSGANSGVLARPFFDTALAVPNSRLVSSNGGFTGNLAATYDSLYWNLDVGGVVRVLETSEFSLEQTFHARHFSIEDRLRISDRSSSTGGTLFFNGGAVGDPTASVAVSDSFTMLNRWYGGAAGLRINYNPGRFGLSVAVRLGVGASTQNLNIDGLTTLQTASGTTAVAPGLLSASTGSITVKETKLSYAPEVRIRASYQLTSRISATVGYEYLYISDIARLGSNIPTRLNPINAPSSQNYLTTGTKATFGNLSQTDFWLHGLTVGLSLSF